MVNSMRCACAGVVMGLSVIAISGAPASGQAEAKADQETQPDDKSNSLPSVKIHLVEPVDLVLRVEREGRIESAQRGKVRIIPETFAGPFEVIEVVQRSGPIRKGDAILRLDTRNYEKELQSARQALDHARRNLELSREEFRILRENNVTKLEQAAKARERSAKELATWEKFDSADMVKQSELGVLGREFGLADQRQELEQLEEMYKGTQLASETKEIVLERARRNVKMSEQWLDLTRHDDAILREHRHPDRDKDVRDQARWTVLEDEHTKSSAAAAEQRKTMDLESAETKLKESEEKYNKLQADGKLFEVSAPQDGIMTRIDLEPRDTINPRAAICEVMNPSAKIVKFPVTAEDLRVLRPDGEVEQPGEIMLVLPEYPDVKVTGEVKDIAEIGEKAEGATQFPMTVDISSDSDLSRLGLRCKVFASRTLHNVLTVPRSAVKWEDGEAWVRVQMTGDSEKRKVIVGPANDKMIAVLSGLKAGEEVLLEDQKAK